MAKKEPLSLVEASGSHYYNLRVGKVRVSDHKPGYTRDELDRVANIEFYTKKKGQYYSVREQIERFCEKRSLPTKLFREVLNDFSKWDGYVKDLRESKTPSLREINMALKFTTPRPEGKSNSAKVNNWRKRRKILAEKGGQNGTV